VGNAVLSLDPTLDAFQLVQLDVSGVSGISTSLLFLAAIAERRYLSGIFQ
jgi:hypothetical protein